ncbi:hypothetical protein BDD12DRAFT_936873 [Trichophaea hybrida]|nr:hypothetical protein BDD12DRAFT_936873 [Trichophaea hybrida]
MATVGALGLALGTAGLITILEATFSVYRHLVEEPASFGKEMAGLYSMFLYEYFRCEVWGVETVGMLREQNRVQSLNNPNSQEGHGLVTVDPTNKKFQHPLLNAVGQVQGVLAEINKLVLRYKVEEAKERSEIQTTSVATGITVVSRLGVGSGGAEITGSMLRGRAFEKQLMKTNSRWRKFMFGVQAWSSADKIIFRNLIDSMHYWNNCILEIGSRSHHRAIDLAASSKPLDGIVDREQLDDVAKVSSDVTCPTAPEGCCSGSSEFHKNLNSRNILFFARSGVASQSPIWDFSSPWVTGFDFARPNQKDEHSFEVDSGENDIYRHPDLRQNIEDIEEYGRAPYRRQFDVYSLGLVLLEIGLWTPLSDLCNQKATPTKATARFKAACNLNVPHQMGTSYNELVLRCLDGDHQLHDEEDQEDGEDRGEDSSSVAVSSRKRTDVSLVAFYWKVIRVLEQCDCRE